jgi:hypothetical protein
MDLNIYTSNPKPFTSSSILQVGSDEVPDFVLEDSDLFRAPARLITRQKGEWYKPSEFLQRV